MNDPGTEKPIQDAADELEPIISDEANRHHDPATKSSIDESEQSQQDDYRDPTRWWFASTGCPLAAGTLGPLASTFNICALVENWRVHLPPGAAPDASVFIADPSWLIAVNALSLCSAVVANALLLLTITQRIRFKFAQPICSLGFFLAAFLLIADIVALTAAPNYRIPMDSPAGPPANHALSSAFYNAIQAAVLYLVVAGLMCLTAYGAYAGHYEAEFKLTLAQRTLMLQTMAFLAYLLLGALVFSHIEGWHYLQAVYWADLTLLTIGLGSDYHPVSHTARALLFFFATGGIIIIGLVIGSIRTLLLEVGKRKISARIMNKKRRRAMDSLDPRERHVTISRFTKIPFDDADLDLAGRRKLEFDVMRAVQDHAERDRRYMALAVSTTAALLLWFLGALVFYHSEYQQNWSYFQSLYFSYTVLLTIGYGDFYPISFAGRAFFVLWTLLAVPTLTVLISDMSDTVVAAFSLFVVRLGTYTVLPGDKDVKGDTPTLGTALKRLVQGRTTIKELKKASKPNDDKLGQRSQDETASDTSTLSTAVLERLALYLADSELSEAMEASAHGDTAERDARFYHFVLAREIRNVLDDLQASATKHYTWEEFEYYLALINDKSNDTAQQIVPRNMQQRQQQQQQQRDKDFSWLSDASPLMHQRSETQWVLERLSMALVRELEDNRTLARAIRKGEEPLPQRKPPPVRLARVLECGRGVRQRRGREGEGGDMPAFLSA